MLVEVVLLVFVVYFTYKYYFKNDFKDKLLRIPTEPGLPLLGHALQFGTNLENLLPSLERMWNKFERDKFILQVGPLNVVMISKPEDVEVILSSSRLIQKNFMYDALHSLLGNGLLTGHGDHWRAHRKLLTPAFHFKILESYLPVMQEETNFMMDDIAKEGDGDINIFDIFYHRALMTLSKLGIGTNVKDKIDFEQYSKDSHVIATLTSSKGLSLWKKYDFIYNITPEGRRLNKSIDAVKTKNRIVLEAKRKELNDDIEKIKSGESTMESMIKEDDLIIKKRYSFMELLILGRTSDGLPLSEKSILEELNTFTLAGHETLTSSTSFTLYCLSNNLEIQEKVYKEQLEVTGGDLSKPLNYNDLQQMKYLDRVIKEALRMFAPVLMFGRRITEDTLLPDGSILPAGVPIFLLPFFTHRNPDLFPNPEKFDPDRFLNQMPNIYMYYPFSAGPRNCIGQKLAMVQVKFWVATVVRSLILLPASGPKPKPILEITLKSATGVLIRAKQRQTNL